MSNTHVFVNRVYPSHWHTYGESSMSTVCILNIAIVFINATSKSKGGHVDMKLERAHLYATPSSLIKGRIAHADLCWNRAQAS